MDTELTHKDQALKEKAEVLLTKTANGTRDGKELASSAAQLASKGTPSLSKSMQGNRTATGQQQGGRVLAVTYLALAAAVVALAGSVGPMLVPNLYEKDTTGIADALKEWSPVPQAGLAALVLALLAAAVVLRGKGKQASSKAAPGEPGCKPATCVTKREYKDFSGDVALLVVAAKIGCLQCSRSSVCHLYCSSDSVTFWWDRPSVVTGKW